MCVAFLLLEMHPRYRLLLLTNRDEFYDRPTVPVHAWEDVPGIIAGRDQVAGGTWLGVTENGRLALVTNFRQKESKDDAPSRGELTVDFLKDSDAPLVHLHKLQERKHRYNGFNLLVADLRSGEVAYLSNGDHIQKPVRLEPGVYGIGNAALNSGWHKINKGTGLLKAMLEQYRDQEIPLDDFIDRVLSDREHETNPDRLPDMGFPKEWEYLQSPIFVEIDEKTLQSLGVNGGTLGGFGTSSSTVVAWSNEQTLTFIEKYRNNKGKWHKHGYTLQVSGSQGDEPG